MSDKKDIQGKILLRIPTPEECCKGFVSDGHGRHCAAGWMAVANGWPADESVYDQEEYLDYEKHYGHGPWKDNDGTTDGHPALGTAKTMRRWAALFPDKYIVMESE